MMADHDDVNSDNSDEEGAAPAKASASDEGQSREQRKKSSTSRRLLRATMSLANFEEQVAHETPTDSRMFPGATVATPEEFVNKFGGKRVINKILIANNGIAGEMPF